MNFAKKNGKCIVEAFVEFHKKNPHIYKRFLHYALERMSGNLRHKISGKAIINRIRWDDDVDSTARDYKINDAFSPYYVRLFIKQFPQHQSRFELRRLRALDYVLGFSEGKNKNYLFKDGGWK
jgi:hypothetical protein